MSAKYDLAPFFPSSRQLERYVAIHVTDGYYLVGIKYARIYIKRDRCCAIKRDVQLPVGREAMLLRDCGSRFVR